MPDEILQRAHHAILSHLVAHGRAPHYVDLADMLGIPIEDARVAQREAAAAVPAAACWLSHDTDYVEEWAPFSNVPTHVRMSIDGRHGWHGL